MIHIFTTNRDWRMQVDCLRGASGIRILVFRFEFSTALSGRHIQQQGFDPAAAEGEVLGCNRLDAGLAAERPRLVAAAEAARALLLQTPTGVTVLQRVLGGTYRAGATHPGGPKQTIPTRC